MKLLDVKLEEDKSEVKREQLQFNVFSGMRMVDILTFPRNSGPSKQIRLPIAKSGHETLDIICKIMGDTDHLASISIPHELILQATPGEHTQWITLFESRDEDAYNGKLGINDSDEPRIQVSFTI